MCYNNFAISEKLISFFFHQTKYRSILRHEECKTLYGILVVLIIFGVPLPVVSQQFNKDSDIIQYTEKVSISDLVKKVDSLVGSVGAFTDKQEPLIEDVKKLREDVVRIDERTQITQTIVIGGIIGLFVAIVGAVIIQIIFVKNLNIRYIQQPVPEPEELPQKDKE